MPDRLIAKCRLPYGRNVYSEGEEFTASSIDAKTLVAIGKAERVDELPAQEPEPVPALISRDMTPELTKRKRGRPRKGEYNRRDMRAAE